MSDLKHSNNNVNIDNNNKNTLAAFNDNINNSTINRTKNQFFDIYEKISSENLTITDKLNILTRFKGHVKKELVNADYIQSYFKTLLYIPNYIRFLNQKKSYKDDQEEIIKNFLLISHSALSYLVKRVSYQSPSSISNSLVNDLLSYFIEIQDIINDENINIAKFNLNKKIWLLSNKAIEILYLTVPLYVEDSLLKLFNNVNESDDCLSEQINNNHLKYILLIIDDLTRINLQSNKNSSNTTIFLEIFLPHFIHLLNNNNIFDLNGIYNENTNKKLIVELITDILTKYLNKKVFAEFKSKLNNSIIRNYFTNEINMDKTLDTGKNNNEDDNDNVNNNENEKISIVNNTTSSPSFGLFDLEMEYNMLLNDYKAPQLTNLLDQNHLKYKSKYDNLTTFSNDLNTLLIPFHERKETEFNWKARQRNIIIIREKLLINEQLVKNSKSELVAALKEMSFIENLSKAILSLRTSLSLNSCQLLKELLELLGDSMSLVLLDQVFALLKQLLSSTKKISSQMALHCMMCFFIYVNEFHNKLFQSAFALMNEKNIVPRNSSTVFLRIFIIKFSKTVKLENNLLYVEEWLKKGLLDAQITVRDSMKLTFWYFYKAYPEHGKSLLHNFFSPQLKRSLESSIPLHLSIDYERPSNNSSSNNSRRSSLLNSHFQNNGAKRKFPSYAQPTQSSSILQKINSATHGSGNGNFGYRSTSDNISHSNGFTSKKFKSGTSTVGRVDSNTLIKRKVSAPVRHTGNNNHMLDTENMSQIDITDEINSPHSNPLIQKYLENSSSKQNASPAINKTPTDSKYSFIGSEEESERIIASFKSHSLQDFISNPQNYKYPLQLLQNFLLRKFDKRLTETTLSAIMLYMKQILLKVPTELKNLLSFPVFVQCMPLRFIIELCSICNMNIDDIILKLDIGNINKFTNEISSLFNDMTSEHSEKDVSLYYMKYREKFFNFTMNVLIHLFEDKAHFNIQDTDFKKLLKLIFDIYGDEFDNTIYFNLIFQLYTHNKKIFLEYLNSLNLVSKKLKISNELQMRDPAFELSKTKLSQPVKEKTETAKAEVNSTQNVLTSNNHDDDITMRKYMEMTMVNPFKQNISLDEQVNQYNNFGNETKPEDNENGSLHSTLDITENKLSQMTKVVSVYQTIDHTKSDFKLLNNIEEEDRKDTVKSEIDLSDIFSKKKPVNELDTTIKRTNQLENGKLDNIDLRNEEDFKPEQEHTVKFSTDPPKVINDEMKMLKKENEDGMLTSNSDIEIRSPESNSRSVLASNNSEKIQPRIKVEEQLEIPRDPYLNHGNKYNLTASLPSDSFMLFELNIIIASNYGQTLDFATKNRNQYDHLLKAVNRIKSGMFTMKHLIYLIEPLIDLDLNNTLLIKWLQEEGGFATLQDICLMLLQSTDETMLIPTNMTSKALILLQCLLLVNEHFPDKLQLSSGFVIGIWDQFIILIDKLSDYNNEIYNLLIESRQLMIRLKYFDSKRITSILNKLLFMIYEYEKNVPSNSKNYHSQQLVYASTKKKEGMAASFLLGTLSDILKDYRRNTYPNNTIIIRDNQFSEIIQSLISFTEFEITEWRYESCNILASIYYILKNIKKLRQEEIEDLFGQLSKFSYRLIKSMASSI